MKKTISVLVVPALGLALTACGHTTTQRAATGAIAGGVVAGPVGAAVGAGAGAVVSKAAGDK
jgi:osmotically inducible lipoprotein OsmB